MKPRVLTLQIVLLFILIPLAYGPLGHYWSLNGAAPDLFLISVWGYAWLTDRQTALVWAVLLGLSMDLISFQIFGLWLAVWVGLTLLIEFLKARYFEVSSVLHALSALLIANLLTLAVEYLLSRTFILSTVLIGIVGNVLIGLIVYYLLVMRWRLTEHWEGRRL